mgnify:CR=1 FL=1
MKKYDITISTILMVVAAGLFTASSGLPAGEGAIGAGTWPRVLAVLLFLLSALLMVQALTGHSSQEEPFDIHSEGFKRVLKGIGIILVLLKFLGFMLASAFMIPTIMRLMGEKRIKVLAGLTVGVLVAVYLIFSVALSLPLLQGSLFV